MTFSKIIIDILNQILNIPIILNLGTGHTRKWYTVSKVHTGHDDATLERLQDELMPNMEKIKGDHTRVPSWLKVSYLHTYFQFG